MAEDTVLPHAAAVRQPTLDHARDRSGFRIVPHTYGPVPPALEPVRARKECRQCSRVFMGSTARNLRLCEDQSEPARLVLGIHSKELVIIGTCNPA
jgi:hypothetical protein